MNKKNLLINIILAILSTVFVYTGYFLFPVLIWIAFVPVIVLVKRITPKENLIFASLISLFLWVSSVYCIINFDKKLAFLMILYTASFVFFFFVILNFVFLKIKNNFVVFFPAILWVLLFELYNSFKPTGSWFNLAYLQPRFSFVSQLVGEAGILFIIVLVNTLLVFAIVEKSRKRYLIPLLIIFLILLLAHVYGQNKETEGRRVRVAVIQGNITQSWDWRVANSQSVILDKYIQLSRNAAMEKPDLIVWPEYAIPLDIEQEKDVYSKISNLAKSLKVNLIIGSLSNVGTFSTDGLTNYFDSAYAFDRNGGLIGRYDALHPFDYKTTTVAGEGYLVFKTDVGRIGIAICFDEVYNEIYHDYNKLGVDYFVTISNNEPIKNQRTMFWMKRISELRAATYGKYYVRSANTGFSQVVDPFGNVINSIPYHKEGYMNTDIYIR